jgi:dynein heavy chain, axonemal
VDRGVRLTCFCVSLGPQLLATPSAKRIVKSYNKIVKTLVAFEYVWYDAWAAQVDKARSGLQATLIVRHPASKKLLVNFDPGAGPKFAARSL